MQNTDFVIDIIYIRQSSIAIGEPNFDDQVKQKIKEGWQPLGPAIPYGRLSYYLVQTLVKYWEPGPD